MLCRLMLEVGGVKYEEEIITFEEWPNRKPGKRRKRYVHTKILEFKKCH